MSRRRNSSASSLGFGPHDLCYGPSAVGALRHWQERHGGRMLNDLPRGPGWKNIDFSLHCLRRAIERGGTIRFDLSHMEDRFDFLLAMAISWCITSPPTGRRCALRAVTGQLCLEQRQQTRSGDSSTPRRSPRR